MLCMLGPHTLCWCRACWCWPRAQVRRQSRPRNASALEDCLVLKQHAEQSRPQILAPSPPPRSPSSACLRQQALRSAEQQGQLPSGAPAVVRGDALRQENSGAASCGMVKR